LSFSAWNWRILGNLLLEVSFDDEEEQRLLDIDLNETESFDEVFLNLMFKNY
jgi:hypothetical protein